MRNIGRGLTIVALAGLALGWIAPRAEAQLSNKRERGVFLEKDALILDVPEVVAGGAVQQALWSPTGRYVLALRTPFRVSDALREIAAGRQPQGPPPTVLVLWDRQSHRSRELSLGRASGPRVAPQSMDWMGGQDLALVTGSVEVPAVAPGQPHRIETWVYRIDPRAAAPVKAITRLEEGEHLVNEAPGAYGVIASFVTPVVRVLHPDGRLTPVRVPEVSSIQFVGWSTDRRSVLLNGLIRRADKKGIDVRPLVIDAATGKLSPMKGEVERYRPAPWKREYAYEVRPAPLTADGVTETITPLWLVSPVPSEAKRLMVNANVEYFAPSPTGDAVLYLAEGSAWVSELARLPRETLVAARDAARRSVLLSNGKQVALSVMMYAQDHDETLPGAGDDVQEKLMPYSKTERIFEGLVYTFAGGKLSDVAEPSKEILGHIPGPGGRAVLYVDGHVVWEKER